MGNIDEVRADILEAFDYTALGHIHKPMKVGSDRFRYCGTPLACSVSEAGQAKGVIVGMAGKLPTIMPEASLMYILLLWRIRWTILSLTRGSGRMA